MASTATSLDDSAAGSHNPPVTYTNEAGFHFNTPADFDTYQAGFATITSAPEPMHGPSSHRCQLFDIPSLLYDAKWLGSDQSRVELVCHTDTHVGDAHTKFVQAFEQCSFDVVVQTEGKMGALFVRANKIERNVEPGPILQLLPLCLWVEPNKLHLSPAKDRTVLLTDPNAVLMAVSQELQQLALDQKLILSNLQGLKGYNPQIPHTKASVTWNEIDRTRKNLLGILKEKRATQALICSFCKRVIRITVSDSPAINSATPIIAQLEDKLTQAKGKDNKQRRKRLQRKKKKAQQNVVGTIAAVANPAALLASMTKPPDVHALRFAPSVTVSSTRVKVLNPTQGVASGATPAPAPASSKYSVSVLSLRETIR